MLIAKYKNLNAENNTHSYGATCENCTLHHSNNKNGSSIDSCITYFFWVIPRRLNYMCWRFGTVCSIFIGRVSNKDILSFRWLPGFWILCADVLEHFVPPSKVVLTYPSCSHDLWRCNRQCAETSAHKIHTPWNHPKERIQHSLHGESLISRRYSEVIDKELMHLLDRNIRTTRLPVRQGA